MKDEPFALSNDKKINKKFYFLSVDMVSRTWATSFETSLNTSID